MLEGLKYEHNSESRQWLFRHTTFQNWIQKRESPSHSRLLWVTGTPGSGKSTAIRGAYHRLLQERDVLEGTHHVAAFFFESNAKTLMGSPKGMYRSLLYQILSRQRRMLFFFTVGRVSSWSVNGQQKPHRRNETDYRTLLLDVLKELCRLSQRITILIDAVDVDECVHDDRDDRDRFLHDIVTSDEFKTLNICLSSRHFGAVHWRWLRPRNLVESRDTHFMLRGLVIEVEVENHSAIRTYLDESLRVYSLETAELVAIKEKIQTKSSGNFLWVKETVDRLVEDLCGHGPRRLEPRLQNPPDRLFHLYLDILDTAEDSEKTWRFFQWLLIAPDLSLRAWRDLIPFLQQKAPRSLKDSRNSKDWACGLSTSREDDSWILHLQQIVCRISLGLAQVAVVPEKGHKMAVGDRHSIAGEAGSWHTADGDLRLVRPVHDSVRQFLQIMGGFDRLKWRKKDQYGEGLFMAMTTCLNFIKAREFSSLSLVSAAGKDAFASGASTTSLLSDGDASIRTSVSRFSSARSMIHKPDYHKIMSSSMSSSGGLSTEYHDSDDKEIQTTAVLANLNQVAERCPESSQEKRHWIERWCDAVGNADQPSSTSCPSVASSFEQSERSLRWKVWSSEFLTYLLTAFPKIAQSAENAGIDSSLIVIRFREGGLWKRWLFLSEQMATHTTLKQWAESQRLHTWVKYLSRTKENPYTFRAIREEGKREHSRWVDRDMNLNYCFDGGDHFVKQVDSDDVPLHLNFGFDGEDVEQVDSRDVPLQKRPSCGAVTSNSIVLTLAEQLWHATYACPSEGRNIQFIPYKLLRSVLTETSIASLLGWKTGISPEKAHEVRESYIRVLGILILIDQVAHLNQLFDAKIDDECLPIRFRGSSRQGNSTHIHCGSEIDTSALGFMTMVLKESFEELQWRFLSPFLARPAGQLQHYNIGSSNKPLPIIECDKTWNVQNTSGYGHDFRKRVRFHPESFDFGKYGVIISFTFTFSFESDAK